MSDNKKRLNYIITVLFIISIVYTSLRLFSLQDDLILSSQALNSSDIASISPILYHLYVAVGIMILTGILVLVINFRTETGENIMTQSSSGASGNKSKSNTSSDFENSEENSIDLSFIQEAIKSTKNTNDKLSAILNTICKRLELGQGAIYEPKEIDGIKSVQFQSGYAFSIAETETLSFEYGEGLVGQAAKEGQMLVIDKIPENYINIISGLGSASPQHLMIHPIMEGNKLIAVIEMASFSEFSKENINLIKQSFDLVLDKSKTDKQVTISEEKDEKKESVKKPARGKKTTSAKDKKQDEDN